MSQDLNSKAIHDLAHETLNWLKNQQVDALPSHYSVGFEHLRGQNSAISQQLSSSIKSGDALAEELNQLYQDHFGSQPDERLEEFRNGLQQILQQAMQITLRPQAEAHHYQQVLEGSRQTLESNGDDLNAVLMVVADLVKETQRMDDSICAMESELRQTSDEVSLLKEQYDEVRNEVFTDPLTGVLNRRGLDNAMRRHIIKSERQSNLALLMIDLDNFKPFNDTHGHLVGDQVLCFAAKILRNVTRGSDIIARYGGDEFAILLPDTDLEAAKQVANNVLDAFNKNKIKRRSSGEVLGTLSASIGIAEMDENETLEDLIERADRGLFASKRNGRNQVTALPTLYSTG